MGLNTKAESEVDSFDTYIRCIFNKMYAISWGFHFNACVCVYESNMFANFLHIYKFIIKLTKN